MVVGGLPAAAMEIPFDGEDTLEYSLKSVTPNSGRGEHCTKTNLTLAGEYNKTNISWL